MERRQLFFSLAFALRCLLPLLFPPLIATLQRRVEINTPLTSFLNLQEGIHLWTFGTSPYATGVAHQSPLLLWFGHLIGLESWPAWTTALLWAALDGVIAYLVYRTAHTLMERDAYDGLVAEKPSRELPETMALLYLWNPFTITTCLAKSTVVLDHVFLIGALALALHGKSLSAGVALASATLLGTFDVTLLPILIAIAAQRHVSAFSGMLLGFVGATAFFHVASYQLTGESLAYLKETLLFTIQMHDLTPNTGVWWYLFTEMFDQWRDFFVAILNLHLVAYLAPLLLRFKRDPMFAFILQCSILAAFRSMPSHGDIALVLTLMLFQRTAFQYLTYPFLVGGLFAFSTVLFYAFWHLWLVQGSGNANFFFAISLLFTLAQCVLIIDLLHAVMRRKLDAIPEFRGNVLYTDYVTEEDVISF